MKRRTMAWYAVVAQLVEHELPKLGVASSNLVRRFSEFSSWCASMQTNTAFQAFWDR
jgi:hypothetical protein